MEDAPAGERGAVLVLHEPTGPLPGGLLEALRAHGWVVATHVLGPGALASDRAALEELDPLLEALRASPGVAAGCLAVLGFGRAGTLAFLLGCTRSLAAVVDVDGPVLHAELSSARPTQPLELALNLEGSFLGCFGTGGPVGDEERGLLAARLGAAAKPFELIDVHGYHEAPERLLGPLLAFLAPILDPPIRTDVTR